MKVSDFTVESVPRSAIQKFIEKWHYSHSTNGVQHTQCFALFDGMTMIGAMMYALPSMKATAAKYNPINPDRCLELRRLCCIDDTPTNTESFFIGKTLRWLKQNTEIEVIISYADLEQGHEGVIYKASNFIHLGNNGGARPRKDAASSQSPNSNASAHSPTTLNWSVLTRSNGRESATASRR